MKIHDSQRVFELNKSEKHYHDVLRGIGCVICREHFNVYTLPEIHHIAQGSGLRSHYLAAPLCVSHHRQGEASLHGAGVKQFTRIFKLGSEYHLLELVNKFRAQDGV